jgi:predicted nucleotidyltransferase
MKNVIVKHLAGSHSYGTNIESSDVDIRGIFCADKVNIRTPFFPIREVTGDGEDEKYYELNNFMKLYTDGNPNILESLWVADSDIIEKSEAYVYLKKNAEALLSKKVAYTFSGYAMSQLKRIKGHNKWMNKPEPEKRPEAIDYMSLLHNFTEDKIFKVKMRDFSVGYNLMHTGSNIYGIYKSTNATDSTYNDNGSLRGDGVGGDLLYFVKFNEDVYRVACENWKNYWNWKKNRNVKRNELEETYGYDTKHAMHLVRLLRMGEEILSGKGVIVKRPDSAELLDIRNGSWGYDDLLKYASEKEEYIRGTLYSNSKLPKAPNIKLASKVLMDVQDMFWS